MPNLHTDPETGETHSVAGASETIYWNGGLLSEAQKYVYTSTARNIPPDRPLWKDADIEAAGAANDEEETGVPEERTPNEAALSEEDVAVAEIALTDDHSPVAVQLSYEEVDHFANRFGDLQRPENNSPFLPLLPGLFPPPMLLRPSVPQQMRYLEPQRQNFPNNDPIEAVWQDVYHIYGTAMGILIKCFEFESQASGKIQNHLFEDSFLERQELPRRSTRELMNLFYSDIRYQEFGDSVIRGERRRRDLKQAIKNGVGAGVWPGNTDFSELRSGFELVRKKATQFLTSYSDQFDAAWEAWRSQRNNGSFR